MLDDLRKRVARWIAPARLGTRSYGGARGTRMTGGFGNGGSSSADTELSTSLTSLRARSRQLMRDAPYAKRARVIVINNVIGAGVGFQAQVKNTRGELHARLNAAIEEAWCEWSKADSCHTGGALHFSDLERALLSEVFTAGEVLIRKHPRKFGKSTIPFALELIEAERLADDLAVPMPTTQNAMVRMGVEVDEFYRPVAYWIRDRHPGELRQRPEKTARIVRVPAEEIIHLRLVDRWPQTRGEPWLHAVVRKLNDMDEYSGAELLAARMSANYFATIESTQDDPLPTEKGDDGSRQINIEPGVIEQLTPGDKLEFHSPNRPNAALDPFLRYMLREVAAGVGVSYESLSRDYSQSNYSSSRLALLDDRDLWRVLQQWWVRSFRAPLHEAWLQQAALAKVIPGLDLGIYGANPKAFEAVTWKLRGWSWVDPTKEVSAYKEAVMAGFTTVSAVIAQTAGGLDIEDVIAERRRELDLLDEAELTVDTTVPEPAEAGKPAAAAAPAGDGADPEGEPGDANPNDATPPARVVSIAR